LQLLLPHTVDVSNAKIKRQAKKNKQGDRKRKRRHRSGVTVLRGWNRGFGGRCRGTGGTDMVLDAIGDGGRGSLTSWQEHKGRGRHPRANGKKGRGKCTESGQDRGRWVVGSVATLTDGGLPDGGVSESPVDPTLRTKGGSPHWSPGVWERDCLYRFTRSREDAHAIYVRRMRVWARVRVYLVDPVDTPRA